MITLLQNSSNTIYFSNTYKKNNYLLEFISDVDRSVTRVVPTYITTDRYIKFVVNLSRILESNPLNGIIDLKLSGYYSYNLYYSNNTITDIDTTDLILVDSNVAVIKGDSEILNSVVYISDNEDGDYIEYISDNEDGYAVVYQGDVKEFITWNSNDFWNLCEDTWN